MRASSLHIGGAAAAASLRTDLVERGHMNEAAFTESYAVARLTPGTNHLALYAALGFRLAAWRGAALTLTVGTVPPSLIATAIATLYVRYSGHPLVAQGMHGARVGAVAVLVWAVACLARPLVRKHRMGGIAFAMVVLAVALTARVPVFLILLAAGVTGAIFFRRDR
jgi:chromate transporter